MVLWADKHRPVGGLSALELHTGASHGLQRMADAGANTLPHLLVYGPAGAGKKTRVDALLRGLYGASKVTVTVGKLKVKVNKSNAVEINELNPSDAGAAGDRVVVQDVIRDIAQTPTVSGCAPVRVVVLHEVDRLSKPAQQALRRTMETFYATCRLVLIATSSCRVIAPIKSRCVAIRIPAPSENEVMGILASVARKEALVLAEDLARRIAVHSRRDLRRALLALESCARSLTAGKTPLLQLQDVPAPAWMQFAEHICASLAADASASPDRLAWMRTQLAELVSHGIPTEAILKVMVLWWLKRQDGDSTRQHATVRHTADFEHRTQVGSQPLFHLEALIVTLLNGGVVSASRQHNDKSGVAR